MKLIVWILVKIICYSIVLYKCPLIFYRGMRYYFTCGSDERWDDYNYNLADETLNDEILATKNVFPFYVDGAKYYLPLNDI